MCYSTVFEMNDVKSFISSFERIRNFYRFETSGNGYSIKILVGQYVFTARIPSDGKSQYKFGDRDTDVRDWKRRVQKSYEWQKERNYFISLRRQQEERTPPTRHVFRHDDGICYTTGRPPREEVNFLKLIGRLK